MSSSSTDSEQWEEVEAPTDDADNTGIQVAPIVSPEEFSFTTGEEDEDPILYLESKLYRFDKVGNQWKERGEGTVKFLKHRVTGKVRLLMRQSKTFKICANHHILPTMTVQVHAHNEKYCVWHARDYADGELKDEVFCIRFTSIAKCKNFIETFQETAESQKKEEENKEASGGDGGGLIEKMSVEEKADMKRDEKDESSIIDSFFRLVASISSLCGRRFCCLR